jgi:hypothetical protein
MQAGIVAEEAYRRFASHADPTTAALVHSRAAYLRAIDSPGAGLPLIKEALRLFEGTPPSVEHAKAWHWYGNNFLLLEGRPPEEIVDALNRALGIAEAAGAATLIPRVLCVLAHLSFLRGEVVDGFRLLAQARDVPEASGDAWAVLTLAVFESDALLKVGRLREATRVGLRGVDDARRHGFGSNFMAILNLSNAVQGLLGRGHTADAAELIAPHTTGPQSTGTTGRFTRTARRSTCCAAMSGRRRSASTRSRSPTSTSPASSGNSSPRWLCGPDGPTRHSGRSSGYSNA